MRTIALLVAVLFAGSAPGLAAEPDLASRLSGVLERQSSAVSRLNAGRPPSWKQIREIEADLVDLLREEPGNPAVAAALGRFYSEWRDLGEPSPDLLAMVEQAQDPVRLVCGIIQGERQGDPPIVRVILAALAARPASSVLWKLAADNSYLPEWKAAFLEEAVRNVGQQAEPAALALVGELLDVELRAGFPAEALAVLADLPPEIRSRVVSGPLLPLEINVEGLRVSFPAPDLRLELAIAQALTGNPRRAAELEKGLPPLAPEPEWKWMARLGRSAPAEPDRGIRLLLDRWLRPAKSDPFGLLADSVSSLMQSWSLDRLLLLARLAEREGYPEMAAYAEHDAVLKLTGQTDSFEGARGLTPRASATARRLIAARESLRKGFRSVRSARPIRPPRVRFEERPLPALVAAAQGESGRGTGGEAWDRRPKNFPALKMGQEGDRVVILGAYPEGDRRLSFAPGLYWVVLSEDRGRTWSRPLATGLRESSPYRWNRGSALPLLDGGRLQLAVTREENDPDYPVPLFYVARPVTRTRTLLLTLPLADLRRDSDGDGLTDLEEQELLTDPDRPDTDGDGLSDANDPMPGVPFDGTPVNVSRAEALASALKEIFQNDPRTYKPGESPVSGGLAAFLVSDPRLFSGFQPVRRTIVLTPPEAVEAEKKLHFETSLWMCVSFDRSGRRALVVWAREAEGGVLHLEDSGQGWKREVFGAWVA
jgi:hypothetical protein